jgi:cytochrome P450
MVAAVSTSTPRVRGVPVLGSLLDFRADRFGTLLRIAREHGDAAWVRLGFFDRLVVSSPELAHELLVEKEDAFVKGQGLSIFARPLLGRGLLTSEGDFHRKQRRLLAPAFVQKRIAAYAAVMAARGRASAERMLAAGQLDVDAEAMRVTLEIVGETLFSAELGAEASEIGAALTEAMERMMRQISSLIPIPPQIPTPSNLAGRRAVQRLDETIYRLVAERRANPCDRGDVLSMLLAARDEDGSSMDDVQVRDEAMTIFLAGHETTATALAWTLYLLAKHPELRARAEAEVDATLGERPPRVEDLRLLPYTLAVFKESMRLYPPAYILGRLATRDVKLGATSVRKGQLVLVNVAGIHRRAATWPDPDRFEPERFLGDAERGLPKNAYMPFGAGPRVCIGNHFALMEGHILLATYLQRLRLDLVDRSARIWPRPLVTLRPGQPMHMRATPRARAS